MKTKLYLISIFLFLFFMSCSKTDDPSGLENFISFNFEGLEVKYTGEFGNSGFVQGDYYAYIGYIYSFGSLEIVSEYNDEMLSPIGWLRSLIGQQIPFDRNQDLYATFTHLQDRVIPWSTFSAENPPNQFFLQIDQVIDAQEKTFAGEALIFIEGTFTCALEGGDRPEVATEGQFRIKLKLP